MPRSTTGADFTDERDIMAVNVLGAMRWLGLAADFLEHQGGGTLVGISSVAGDRGRPGNGAYMASKSALSSYLDSLRFRLAPTKVRVVTIKAGFVATPMTAGLKLPRGLTISADNAARRSRGRVSTDTASRMCLACGPRSCGLSATCRPRSWRGCLANPGFPDPRAVSRRPPKRLDVKGTARMTAQRTDTGRLTVALETIEGYGMRQRARCRVVRPTTPLEVAMVFADAREAGVTVGLRGAGCSYGDAALNDGGAVLDCSRMNHILAWDPGSGELTVEPGVTIEQIWRHTLADGWWPPVIPGTMAVTVGGAAAGNIHGKNQWRDGSFGEHIVRFDLLLPTGQVVLCARDQHPDLFFAAIGGWGLLGCITSITLRLRRIYSGLVHVTQTAHGDLDSLLAALDAGTVEATHLVGWIDTAARGRHLGRGLLKSMREPIQGEDPDPALWLDPNSQPPPSRLYGVLPTTWLPILGKPIATPIGIRLANRAQWVRGNLPGAAHPHYERYVPANFILNFVPNFKRIYLPGGLIQHQTFAPRAVAPRLFGAILALAVARARALAGRPQEAQAQSLPAQLPARWVFARPGLRRAAAVGGADTRTDA